MKHLLIIFLSSLCLTAFSQNTAEYITGNVSYISSQNIYTQFVNTSDIRIGDTIYISKNNELQPVMVVRSLSSISCVGTLIGDNILAVTNQVFAKKRPEVVVPVDVIAQKSKKAIAVNDLAVNTAKKKEPENLGSSFDGRVSVSSYINNTSDTTINSVTRFNLSLNAVHIANSGFSAECYVSLTNKNGYLPKLSPDTLTIKNYKLVPTNDLKIYDLSVKYDFNKTASLVFGRKINSNLANIGAVDGLQFENNGKHFSYGALIGSSPDIYTYNFNTNQLQFGAFVSHHLAKENGYMQTSLAVFNQMSNLLTNRRFIYIQHSNSLLKNLDLFCSFEIDLYGAKIQTNSAKVKNSLGNDSTVIWTSHIPANIIDLTSAYVSLNYRPLKNLSLSLSYDARKNIYYYETYKNYIDSVLDKETRSGLRFQASYRPLKYITIGGNAGYRFATPTTTASSNGYGYLTYSQLPFIGASLTIDATVLNTNYLTGIIYGGAISRDFLNGKVFTELSYRYVNYTYKTTTKELENIGQFSFSWRIAKKLILSADFEGTMNPNNNLQWRSFINISQRF